MTRPDRRSGSEDNPPSNKAHHEISGILTVIVGVIAAAAGVAALVDNKSAVVVMGVLISLGTAIIAVFARRGNHATLLKAASTTAVVLAVLTIIYGLLPEGITTVAGKPSPAQASSTPSAPTSTATSTSTSSSSAPARSTTRQLPTASTATEEPSAPPLFEGTADFKAGQMIDLEAEIPLIKTASGVLVKPFDVRIDPTFGNNASDRDGPLLPYRGHPNKGREGCKELLEADTPRVPYYAIPNQWFCLLTSEGRIGLVFFGGSDLTTINSLRYSVWDA